VTARNYKRLILSFSALPLGFGIASIVRAEVVIEPKVQLEAIYTDNVELTGSNEQSDVILRGSPGLFIGIDRERTRGNIDYNLSGFFSTHDTSRSEIRHRLNGFVEGDVVRDLFSIRVNGSIGQQFADISGPISANSGNFTTNRRTVQGYSVTPRLYHEFGSFGRGELSYTFGYSNFENDSSNNSTALFDSKRHRGSASFSSGSRFTRLSWTLDGFYDRVRRGNGSEFEAIEGSLDLGYALGRKIKLVGNVGYEDFQDDTLGRDEEGLIWNAGVRVTPSRRSEFEFRAGERFGDVVFSGKALYRFDERHTISGNYSEDIQVFGRGNIDRISLIDAILRGIPVDENGVPITVGAPGFELTNLAFRQKRASLSVARSSRLFSTTVTGFWERRRFDGEPDARISYGGTVNLGYTIDASQTANVSVTYRNSDLTNGLTNEFLSFSTNYDVKLTEVLTGSLRYIHSRRIGASGVDLSENAAIITIGATF
jgi:uncharacterized protein (PEP-CTERM system associated)